MKLGPFYPTAQHADAAGALTDFFSRDPAVSAVLLTASCARGKASSDSCLDIYILLRPEMFPLESARLERSWQSFYESEAVFRAVREVGAFSQVDLNFTDGVFNPADFPHGWTSGADEFELAVGNVLAYSAPLFERDAYYQQLRGRWLPYYAEDLRHERLEKVLRCCRNNLVHIPLYAPRGLYFQCFKRFYHAFEEFLQALFIARRKYPIAYDKWVQEGVTEILGLPDLYARLPGFFEIQRFESLEIVDKARQLEGLIGEYIPGAH